MFAKSLPTVTTSEEEVVIWKAYCMTLADMIAFNSITESRHISSPRNDRTSGDLSSRIKGEEEEKKKKIK